MEKSKEIDAIGLLDRREVRLDTEKISAQLTGQTILVTGAGGSIGSEIVRQLIHFSPGKIILVGHGENSIYLIHRELENSSINCECVPLIADIQDRERMFQIMRDYQPDVVYHVAAHKHVPLMEANPREAVKNNIYGTKNVADAAKESKVTSFVMISTDKAVKPANVMGASKRIAEMIVTALNENGQTKFVVVRFGNVLGSRGGVVDVFQKQIEKGGPVLVTDFRMERYFMTIPEASRLVLQAGALAEGGEIFVLDMGKPIKIVDLARKMIRQAGQTEADIPIIESGIRPGEKLKEEFLTSKEVTTKKVYEKIFIGKTGDYRVGEVMQFVDNLNVLSEAELKKQLITFANYEFRSKS